MQDIAGRCIQMISEIKKIPAERIDLHQTFEELEFDSLDKASLVFDIEEAFGITIPDSRLASITNVTQMVDGITTALAAKTTSARVVEG